MELEELKKSWNALDEHLKDREFIKEEELKKLIGSCASMVQSVSLLRLTISGTFFSLR